MRKLYPVIVCLLIVGIIGCTKKTDVESEADAIRNADTEWSKGAEEKDAEKFTAAFAENGSILPPNATIVTGRDAIREWFSGMSTQPGFSVSWKPTVAEVSASGDLGYTIGTYDSAMQDPSGNMMTERGKYVAIWKKTQEGKWEVALAIYNSDIPMPTPTPTAEPIPGAMETSPAPEMSPMPGESPAPEATAAPMETEAPTQQ